MTITILPFLVDELGGNPQPVGDPIDRDWPGDNGPLVGDTIPTCADGMLQPWGRAGKP